MSHQLQLEKEKYRNWVKAGLGLKYLKEGIEPFSDDIVQQQHADILNTVKQTNNVTTVNYGQCNLKTLQPNHVRIRNGDCPLGQSNCNCLYPRGKIACPNNVCGAIYDTIVTLHSSTPPSPFWKNTDIQKWCTDPWAVAKCFINAQGYAQKTTAAEIDCSGLLHVIINNKGLHSHIQCVIAGNDAFCKTRHARNAIFHSVTMELESKEVDDYIDNMIAILKDGKELYARPESIEAVKKLEEIKTDAFIITKETERDVIRTAQLAFDQKGKELEHKIATAMTNIERESKKVTESQEKAKAEFLESLRSTEINIEKKSKATIDQIELREASFTEKAKSNAEEHKARLQNITEESIDQIKTAGEATIRKLRDAIRLPIINEQAEERNPGVKSMPDIIQQSKPETTMSKTLYCHDKSKIQRFGEDYESKKRVLQTQLVDLYRKHYLNTSSSPLKCLEDDAEIQDVYVSPRMNTEKLSGREGSEVKYLLPITSYRGIFYDDRKETKSIYILGEVGTGKSSFCKMMIYNWCEAITGNADGEQQCGSNMSTKPENIETMKKFDFLFFLSLRHLSGYSDSLFEMITISFRRIIEKDFLVEVLDKQSQRCLILADGLDEWAPPRGPMLPHISNENPSRNDLKNATVITMSRPSARGILNLKSCEYDLRINLLGIGENMMAVLIEKYMKKMRLKDATAASFV